jgi:hypothetical protein
MRDLVKQGAARRSRALPLPPSRRLAHPDPNELVKQSAARRSRALPLPLRRRAPPPVCGSRRVCGRRGDRRSLLRWTEGDASSPERGGGCGGVVVDVWVCPPSGGGHGLPFVYRDGRVCPPYAFVCAHLVKMFTPSAGDGRACPTCAFWCAHPQKVGTVCPLYIETAGCAHLFCSCVPNLRVLCAGDLASPSVQRSARAPVASHSAHSTTSAKGREGESVPTLCILVCLPFECG